LPSEKPWHRLADIAENARKILAYTDGMTYAEFSSNDMAADATERCMSRISEAAVKLGAIAEELLPSHDWQAIRGIGNVLRHDYDSIILHRTWETVEKNIRPLLLNVEAAITAHEAAEK
jgi:uncharacterized protein with HEPN domain